MSNERLKVLLKRIGGIEGLRMFAEMGSLKAQYDLGLCYNLGIGVERDDDEARKWFGLVARDSAPHSTIKMKARLMLLVFLSRGDEYLN